MAEKRTDAIMLTFQNYLLTFLDYLTGHLILASYLLAITDEQAIWKRIKKLPLLLLSPLIASLIAIKLYAILEFNVFRYFIGSIIILAMCTLWVMWAWRWDLWRAFSAVCMAGILQVATSALAQILFLIFPDCLGLNIGAMTVTLLFSIAVAVLLKQFHFGSWFRLLLEDQSGLRRTAVLLFALEISMETFLVLQNGVQDQYLAAYFIVRCVPHCRNWTQTLTSAWVVLCRLEVFYPVEAVNINVWDFVRCLGVLVDNAIEAALGAGRPWVEIILLVQDSRVFLRVTNPYTNIIEPEKIWDDGWSTKGTGRGFGLPGYQLILENYPNASACTSWENGVFVQELTVEDRS